jgi:hypothetical protein
MKTLKEERAIIFRAVREAKNKQDFDRPDRESATCEACIVSSRRGVNIASANYLNDILIEALDKNFSK